MNCEQAEELMGAYALEALPDDERAAVQAHLATCPEHAAKAAELRAVALTLHDATEPMTPPAGLRSRITSAIAATPQGARSDQPTAITDYQAWGALPTTRRAVRRPAQYVWGAIAAALLIAVGGLLAWNITLQGNNGSSPEVLAVRPLTQDSGATAGYLVLFDDRAASVVGESLPRLDASQVYQLWALSSNGTATSLGLMHYDDKGIPIARASLGGSDVTTVAITIEPAGGSDQPTSAPLYTART